MITLNQAARVWPGRPYPLGATWDGAGVNFAVYSSVADAVELCLFTRHGRPERSYRLPECTGGVWHGYLPRVQPGQRYGYRVHGPYDPSRGLRCNPSKLLLDPYAKAIEGQPDWDEALYGYYFNNPQERNDLDSAEHAMFSVVINPFFDWGHDHLLNIPYHETVIYEAHVIGLTMTHPDVPAELRGTYAGVAHPAVIEHLTGLGVTAVELMPVHQFVQDNHLAERGLRNYWGYNTIGFFAPHNEYSAAGQRGEHEEALKYLEQAYAGFPDPEVAAHIVEVLAALDRREEALERLAAAEGGKLSRSTNQKPHLLLPWLAELISDLVAFERYSSECESRNLKDAALHAYLHATASHARNLIEGALAHVIEVEGIEVDA